VLSRPGGSGLCSGLSVPKPPERLLFVPLPRFFGGVGDGGKKRNIKVKR
jgi:hypothetical protein